MPYDIQDLDTNRATCTSALGIEVTYRIANLTENTVKQLQTLADDDDRDVEANLEAMTSILARLLARWDLTDHGVPVATTREAISDVPAEIRADVLRAILTDARLGESTGTASPPPSRAASGRGRRSSSRTQA